MAPVRPLGRKLFRSGNTKRPRVEPSRAQGADQIEQQGESSRVLQKAGRVKAGSIRKTNGSGKQGKDFRPSFSDICDRQPPARRAKTQIPQATRWGGSLRRKAGHAAFHGDAVFAMCATICTPCRKEDLGTAGPTQSGQQHEYQVVVRILKAGNLTFQAELTSDKLLQPLGTEATTEVLP